MVDGRKHRDNTTSGMTRAFGEATRGQSLITHLCTIHRSPITDHAFSLMLKDSPQPQVASTFGLVNLNTCFKPSFT